MPILPANFVFFPNPNTDSSNLAMGSSQTLHTKRFIQGYHMWDGFREAKSEMQMIKKAAACTMLQIILQIIYKSLTTFYLGRQRWQSTIWEDQRGFESHDCGKGY